MMTIRATMTVIVASSARRALPNGAVETHKIRGKTNGYDDDGAMTTMMMTMRMASAMMVMAMMLMITMMAVMDDDED